MEIDTTWLKRCIATLEKAFGLLQNTAPESIDHEMYRAACVKEFEIILVQSGKLLRKALIPWFDSPGAVDQLDFKDVFRHAVLRNIMSAQACERWLQYRDNRNNTAHDYGENFAIATLVLLPPFIADATALVITITELNNN